MSAIGELVDYVTTGANWEGSNGIPTALAEHVKLSALSVALAAGIAVPAGVFLGHVRRGGFVAVSIVNIGRAIPTIAIIALLNPISLRYEVQLGFWPTAVALVLLAIPPIFTNTYTGVRDVERSVVESARAMGLRARQVVLGVEVPNALPLILTGLRVSAVQVVATATLSALVGYGGLGGLIIRGIAQQDDGKLLTGAVLVAVLAILTELSFGVLERRTAPWLRTAGRRRPPDGLDVPSTAAPDPASAIA
jgi:osmoprotectant transport system permease protein